MNILSTVLLVLQFAMCIFVIHYFLTARKESKLKIRETMLNIELFENAIKHKYGKTVHSNKEGTQKEVKSDENV